MRMDAITPLKERSGTGRKLSPVTYGEGSLADRLIQTDRHGLRYPTRFGSIEEEVVEPWISLLTLGVRDIERSRRFYRDGLGWLMSEASTGDVAFFRTGGVVLALYKRELLAADANLSPEGSGFSGIGLAHNVATRELVDAALEAAVAAGGTLLKLGTAVEWGGYTGYFADPDGFLWEIAWNPGFPLREDGSIDLP